MQLLALTLCLGIGAAQTIPGYSHSALLLGGRFLLGWDLVGNHVRFAFEAGGYEWVALGFQVGSRMNGDAVIAEPTKIAAYDVQQAVNPTLKTTHPTPYFTNGSVTMIGNTLHAEFTRTLAAPNTGDAVINKMAARLLLAVSPDPFPAQHTIRETVVVNLTEAPQTLAPSAAPTIGAGFTTLGEYSHNVSVLGGKVKFGWKLVSTGSVKFGFEAAGAEWVGLGFQDPTVQTRMTGDAVIVRAPNSIGAYSLKYALEPTVKQGVYFSQSAAGRTGNLLHGEFTRTLVAPLAGTVNISDTQFVRLMLAYGDMAFPAQHPDRVEITINLGVNQSTTPSVPSSAPSVFLCMPTLAIVGLVGLCF